MSPHGVIAAAAWRIPLLAKGGHLLALEPGLAFSFSKASSMKIADAAGVVSDYKSDVFFSDVSLPVLATYGYTFAGIVAPYIALGPRLCYNIDTYSARESIYSGTSTTHFAIQAALGGGVTLWDHYRLGAYYCFGLFNREFRSEDRNLFPSNVVATFCYIF